MKKNNLTYAMLSALLLMACQNKNTATNSTGNDTTSSAATQQSSTSNTKTVLVFGDSLTEGYGLDDPDKDAYPSILQNKIDSAKLPYKIVNAGVSGETTAGGKSRIDWTLKQPVDIFILELGANDGLRGIPSSETSSNLQFIIDKVKAKYPKAKIVLTGMQIPPSMGANYAAQFKAVFPQLAQKNHIALVPFLLQGVGGVPALNQKDGIHPTPAGAKILANNVWAVLEGELK
ncbi:arylesterase [Mucilaginibacter koreensis]